MVIVGTFAAQILMCQYLYGLTKTTPLGRSEWGACVAVGATPLLVAALLKLTPESWVAKTKATSLIDEDKAASSKVLDTWNSSRPAVAKRLQQKVDSQRGLTRASLLPEIGVHGKVHGK